MIRSSSHHFLNHTNIGKVQNIHALIAEYRRVAKLILDDIWENGYEFEKQKRIKRKNKVKYKTIAKKFSVKNDQLDFPQYLDYNKFKITTTLSARLLSSLVTQLSGIIRSATEKRRRMLYVYNKKISQRRNSRYLNKKLKTKAKTVVKPNLDNMVMEFSSKNADIRRKGNDCFLKLKCLGMFEAIHIPLHLHSVDHKWLQAGCVMMNSFLINDSVVNLRYEKKITYNPTGTEVIGADQGERKVLQLSDNQKTPKKCKHGHTLSSIIDKLSRKKKGTKAFKKAQDHRNNFINWSINQLNISSNDMKEFRLEKIFNIRYKNPTSRKRSHWTHATIEKKTQSVCEEREVPFSTQSCTYRSQRCHKCGLVLKKNRINGSEDFICNGCGHKCDADFNAAKNHSYDLFILPTFFKKLRLNRTGFYWKHDGVYDRDDKEYNIDELKVKYLESLKQSAKNQIK